MLRLVLLTLLSVVPLLASAENFFSRQWTIFNNILDRFEDTGYDSTYISLPAKRWAVGTDCAFTNSDVVVDADSVNKAIRVPMHLAANIKISYRYLSLSFLKFSFFNDDVGSFSFGINGRIWGFNLDLNSTSLARTTRHDPLQNANQASLFASGYYVFNNRRFLISASEGRDMVQKRSAGSLLIGATYYFRDISIPDSAYSNHLNMSHLRINNGGPSTITANATAMTVLGPIRTSISHSWHKQDLTLSTYTMFSATGYTTNRYISITEMKISLSYRFRF